MPNALRILFIMLLKLSLNISENSSFLDFFISIAFLYQLPIHQWYFDFIRLISFFIFFIINREIVFISEIKKYIRAIISIVPINFYPFYTINQNGCTFPYSRSDVHLQKIKGVGLWENNSLIHLPHNRRRYIFILSFLLNFVNENPFVTLNKLMQFLLYHLTYIVRKL